MIYILFLVNAKYIIVWKEQSWLKGVLQENFLSPPQAFYMDRTYKFFPFNRLQKYKDVMLILL